MNVFWFIPTHGDSRYLGTSEGARAASYDYFQQIAVAADTLGYEGVLLPTGQSCEDSWIVASALVTSTEKLRFLVAVRPGLQPPSVAARMTATLDRLSNGRLLINVVTGGYPIENKGDGIFLPHDERYEITREFLNVYSDLLAGKTVNVQWAIPEPTAVAMLQTQRFLFSPAQDYPGFSDAMWADALPRLIQAKLVESFENYDITHAPLRAADAGQPEFQVLIDVRRFGIAVEELAAEIALSARIVDRNGKVVAARLFEESGKIDQIAPPAAAAAFSEAFGRIAKNMIAWTVEAF